MCIHISSEMVATCLCDMLHYILSAAYARCCSVSTINVVCKPPCYSVIQFSRLGDHDL